MNEEQLRNALQAEYLHLQKVIEDFDGRALTIKAWSVTFSLVTIAGFFATQKPAVLMVACFSALLFWYIEASWKTFQYAYYDRAWEIEEYFRGKKIGLCFTNQFILEQKLSVWWDSSIGLDYVLATCGTSSRGSCCAQFSSIFSYKISLFYVVTFLARWDLCNP